MGNLVLKGHISYATKRKYKWVAEFGKNTCEKCAALDGQEFDEDEVPYWPHPNCRCRVEEISVVDEIESELNEYREEIEQLKLQANELLGDANVLREQIETLQREAKSNVASPLDSQLTRIEYEIYKLIDKISSLTIDEITTRVLNNIQDKIEYLKKEFKPIKNSIDMAVKAAETIAPKLHDAAGFWNVSSNPQTSGKGYLQQENAKIANTLNDLDSQKLKDFISNKLKSQKMSQNTVGVVYDKNSSVSRNIANSIEFKTLIRNNKNGLMNNRSVKDNYLLFELKSNLNLYLAIKHSDVIDIYLDSNNTLHATVIDTYDFNEGETDILVSIPRELQKNGEITPYYSVIKIEVPETIWTKY